MLVPGSKLNVAVENVFKMTLMCKGQVFEKRDGFAFLRDFEFKE
jgi:hypothetical protein